MGNIASALGLSNQRGIPKSLKGEREGAPPG